jgi:hypothetical protein
MRQHLAGHPFSEKIALREKLRDRPEKDSG